MLFYLAYTVAQQIHEMEEMHLDEGRTERKVHEDPVPQEPSVPGTAIVHKYTENNPTVTYVFGYVPKFLAYLLNGWIVMNILMYFCTM